MEKTNLNHEHPKLKEARYIEEVRQLSYQQRFEKMIAIIELSILFNTAYKSSKKNNLK